VSVRQRDSKMKQAGSECYSLPAIERTLQCQFYLPMANIARVRIANT
jgi:hypothetical protein